MTTDQKLELIMLFKEITRNIKHSFRKVFGDTGITMPQGMVIGILYKNGEMMISDLSSRIGLSNSTASGIIDRLEKQEMVQRTRSQEDKRAVYVKLTPQYEKTYKDTHCNAEEHFSRLLENATEVELEKIVEGLTALRKVLERNETVTNKNDSGKG